MSPLDDELRAAFRARAGTLEPSPDPLAGIERRARGLRRRRVATSVAGAALAVSAVALVVPALLPGTAVDQVRPPLASQPPSAAPAPPPAAGPFALDPAAPWPYRGDPSVPDDGVLETFAREYETRHGQGGTFTPLYGERDEAAGEVTVVWVGTVGELAFWGVVRSAEGGPDWLVDRPLPEATASLPFAVGDDVARLVVVAAPGTQVAYCPTGTGSCSVVGTDGVGTAPLGDTSRDTYRVEAPDGADVAAGSAPESSDVFPPDGDPRGARGDEVPAPANAVDWPAVGGASAELVEEALSRFAAQQSLDREQVGGRPLYGYQPPGSTRGYLLLQVWTTGGDARALGVAFDGSSGAITSTSLSGPLPRGVAVLAVLFPREPGSVQQLLVVPRPRAGQVLYSPDASTPPEPVPSQGSGAAVVVPREVDPQGDRLVVLDGERDRPLYDGTVEQLLASLR